jgi:DNA-binding protein HU-beta
VWLPSEYVLTESSAGVPSAIIGPPLTRADACATQVTTSKTEIPMNRIDLLETITSKHDVSRAEAGRILATILDAVVDTVKKGDTVSLVGFGTFKQTARAARSGRNPQTGATVKIPAAKLPKFVAGTAFKAAVDSKFAKRKAEKAAAKPVVKKSAAKKAAPVKAKKM